MHIYVLRPHPAALGLLCTQKSFQTGLGSTWDDVEYKLSKKEIKKLFLVMSLNLDMVHKPYLTNL